MNIKEKNSWLPNQKNSRAKNLYRDRESACKEALTEDEICKVLIICASGKVKMKKCLRKISCKGTNIGKKN